MKTIHSMMIAALGLASLFAAARADAGQADPEIIIYRFPGVYDSASAAFQGIATAFHCSNFSGATENIRVVTRGASGDLRTNIAFPINHLSTVTASTHQTNLYSQNSVNLGTGQVTQGTAAIAATSINIVCTAVTIGAADFPPPGFALRGVRFNPAPGSQE